MKKLKKAEDNMKLTTDTENDRVSRKNRHKKVYTSDESCQDDFPILKKIKSMPKPPLVESSVVSTSNLIKNKSLENLFLSGK